MSDQPRVFHLITRLLKGGAEAKTIETVLGLDGYEFVVGYGHEYDIEQATRLESHGVETQQFRTIRHYNPVTALPAVLAVARYIQREEFDIVHTHSTEAGIIGRFAAAIAGTPVAVHTVHGVPFADDRNPLLETFVLRCERLAATYTDRLITNADAITEDYLRRSIGHPGQYTTVYSGIDIDQFQTAEPASDVTGSGVRILSVGRLADGKGFEDLLAALHRLESSFSAYIVGDGPLREELEDDIDARGLSDQVHLLGYRDDVASIMAACDVFVLPSYREGTPRVITEAMASGLPVVSTDIAGIPEQVVDGENGFLIAPGNIEGLTDRLEQLITSATIRERFGKVSQGRVGRFSTEAMLVDLDEVYGEILVELQK